MELPINTDRLRFFVASEPEPLLRFETLAVVTDDQGHAIFELDLAVVVDGETGTFPVRTATEPQGLVPGQPVRSVGLVVCTGELDEEPFFSAAAIEPAPSPSEAA